jgi:hypothetical protein
MAADSFQDTSNIASGKRRSVGLMQAASAALSWRMSAGWKPHP